MKFVNDPNFYATVEEFETRKREYLNYLVSVQEKTYVRESAEDLFVSEWVKKSSFLELSTHESKMSTERWRILDSYDDWVRNNADADDIQQQVRVLSMQKAQILQHSRSTRESILLYDAALKNRAPESTFLASMTVKELKKFYKRCSGLEEFLHHRTFNAPCGCITWKGRIRKSAKGDQCPDLYRDPVDGSKKRPRGHPAVLLWSVFRSEIVADIKTMKLEKRCADPLCVNPFHFELIHKKNKRKRTE